ncbi:hypothetical protein KBD75_01310 [Candidatus Woesebacteria bacterium]|nr:hypothetical protein [Candidatus Woesebacteria bacterium]
MISRNRLVEIFAGVPKVADSSATDTILNRKDELLPIAWQDDEMRVTLALSALSFSQMDHETFDEEALTQVITEMGLCGVTNGRPWDQRILSRLAIAGALYGSLANGIRVKNLTQEPQNYPLGKVGVLEVNNKLLKLNDEISEKFYSKSQMESASQRIYESSVRELVVDKPVHSFVVGNIL